MIDGINNSGLRMSFGRRFSLFTFIFIFCFIVCAFIVAIVSQIKGGTLVAAMRIMTVVQDIVVFILPAILTTILIARRPDEFLFLNRKPQLKAILVVLLTLVVSIPAMNLLIEWNESISFPESLKAVEQWMRASEENAADSINLLLGGETIADLILSVLIVGLLTGLSEELFFRGILQKLMITRPMNVHFAIWATAFIFSAIHLQFFGFFPRLLLGVFFGYLVWWSKCLWLPVIAHAFNNSLVVVTKWMEQTGVTHTDLSEMKIAATVADVTMVAASIVATVITIWLLYRMLQKN